MIIETYTRDFGLGGSHDSDCRVLVRVSLPFIIFVSIKKSVTYWFNKCICLSGYIVKTKSSICHRTNNYMVVGTMYHSIRTECHTLEQKVLVQCRAGY